jgi:LPS-assembly lipoprotein
MPIRAAIVLVCAVLSLSACGWRLQGATKLSPTMTLTYVDAKDRYTEFNQALRERLRASGAKVTERSGDATATVKIIKDQSGQRVLSVSARNTPEEYEVFYSVEYSVVSGGNELIPPQKLELTRDYSYDTTAVLAKEREQAVLREALAQDLAGLVLRRLASL